MRRLFGTLSFLAIILVAVALWRGWITVFVNEHQIQRDEHKVERTAERTTEKLKENVHRDAKKIEERTDN